jgi:hypothetical protein
MLNPEPECLLHYVATKSQWCAIVRLKASRCDLTLALNAINWNYRYPPSTVIGKYSTDTCTHQ